jgi:hypothetical protein
LSLEVASLVKEQQFGLPCDNEAQVPEVREEGGQMPELTLGITQVLKRYIDNKSQGANPLQVGLPDFEDLTSPIGGIVHYEQVTSIENIQGFLAYLLRRTENADAG